MATRSSGKRKVGRPKVSIKGDRMLIEVALDGPAALSESGKTETLATTGFGTQVSGPDGTLYHVTATVGRYVD